MSEEKVKVTKDNKPTTYPVEALKNILGPWDGDILEVYGDGKPMTIADATAFVNKKKKEGVKA